MDEIERVNRFARGGLDWAVDRWDGSGLRLRGGHEPAAPWGALAELVFHEASYVQCPDVLYEAVFRAASEPEVSALRAIVAVEPEDRVFAIDAGTSASTGRLPFLVVAQGVTFHPASGRRRGGMGESNP